MNLPYYTERRQPVLGEFVGVPFRNSGCGQTCVAAKKIPFFLLRNKHQNYKKMLQNNEFLSIICFHVSLRQSRSNFGQMRGIVWRDVANLYNLSPNSLKKYYKTVLKPVRKFLST